MIIWSVSSHLEKILSQTVSRISKSESIVNWRNNTILSTCFTSVSLWLVTDSFICNTIWEDIVISLNAHNKGSEIKIILWWWNSPDFLENIIHEVHGIQMHLKSLVHDFSILCEGTLEHLIMSSGQLISFRINNNMDEHETCLTFTTVEFSNEFNFTGYWFVNIWEKLIVVIFDAIWIFIVGKSPIVESISISILEKWLSISNSISCEFHWHSKFFWEMVHSDTIILGFQIIKMTFFQKISWWEHWEISEKGSVKSFIGNVNFFKLFHEVW